MTGPEWDGKEEPRRLSVESNTAYLIDDKVIVAEPISNYAWCKFLIV